MAKAVMISGGDKIQMGFRPARRDDGWRAAAWVEEDAGGWDGGDPSTPRLRRSAQDVGDALRGSAWETGEAPVQPAAPRVRVIAPAQAEVPTKLKVAAYCRVSTLMDSQEGSIDAQRRHFEQAIASNPEWEPAGIYLEAGVTGTKAETRPELQRLLTDCRAGRVDLILTKSISRFARNTADCLQLVRTLTDLGIHLSFEKEGIHTARMESELILSILACLAEEESRSISDNMKWGVRKRFQAGTYRGGKTPFGYTRHGSDLLIHPEEARIVRGIFAQAVAGAGPTAIARELNAQGLRTRQGNAWRASTVRKMLRNPVYVGDTLYQQTYVDDAYRQRPNNGELDRYYEVGHHEAIVSREDFALAGGLCEPAHPAR